MEESSMKVWENAEMRELNISETAYSCSGGNFDGGYIGDGILSGHLSDKDCGYGKPDNIFEAIIGNGTPENRLS